MSTLGKIISIANAICLLGFIYLLSMLASTVAFIGNPLILIALLVIVVAGVVSSIRFYRSNRKGQIQASRIDNILALFPVLNVVLIGVVVLSIVVLA